ncbi:maleylpyruvate isomerase family mycothiol-dependent enzyme [Arachnia propionica]|nr:maleylpyruvate isomerase family mycothiol-dependent enzyme [Arachnia propionica]MDO5081896.1 maleylpyruvate isomerase family mycothiol-dependent enzyme [Arachnia propionica]
MSLAKRQRAALCDLMAELGPTAPTRCLGWDVADLAAHMWVREHRPSALPGIGVARFARRTQRIQDEALRTRGFNSLVTDLRRPGWVMLPLDHIVNAVEFFIHHEDVLRANGRHQVMSATEQAELWRTARVLALKAQHAWGGRLRISPIGGRPIGIGQGDRPVNLHGHPSELLLFLSGRRANVTVTAEPEAAKALVEAIGSL